MAAALFIVACAGVLVGLVGGYLVCREYWLTTLNHRVFVVERHNRRLRKRLRATRRRNGWITVAKPTQEVSRWN